MLSWEYPPKVIGGLARAVADLSQALATEGHEVDVVTSDFSECNPTEYVSGVRVYRVNQHYPNPLGFLDTVLFMNYHLIQKGIELLQTKRFDVIHAHDWLVAPSAKVLKHAFKKPLVATIHATEWGRNNGLHNDLQRHISDMEWWLTYEAYQVICCSRYMRDELRRVFQVPDDKIAVIPNGVKVNQFADVHENLNHWRNQWALPEESIVFYVGRHVHEKGLDLLLDAVPRVLAKRPQTKFIIAGTGPMHDELKKIAHRMGIGHKVLFAGFIDDLTRNSLYRLADVAVFPSRYEPFGIVALEAMAAQAPLVVSDIGGFAEIVSHNENGLTFYSGNAESLSHTILALLDDKQFARHLSRNAFNEVLEKYDWNRIALQTVEEYQRFVPGGTFTTSTLTHRAEEQVYNRYHVTSNFPDKGGEILESSNHGRR